MAPKGLLERKEAAVEFDKLCGVILGDFSLSGTVSYSVCNDVQVRSRTLSISFRAVRIDSKLERVERRVRVARLKFSAVCAVRLACSIASCEVSSSQLLGVEEQGFDSSQGTSVDEAHKELEMFPVSIGAELALPAGIGEGPVCDPSCKSQSN